MAITRYQSAQFSDDSGFSVVERVNGVLQKSDDNGQTFGPLGGAGFGSDTIVQLPNASAALVAALELINSLRVNTAGSEESQWAVKLLKAGAQAFAGGFSMAAGTGPMVCVGDPANITGWRSPVSTTLDAFVASSYAASFTTTGLSMNLRMQEKRGTPVASATTITLAPDGNLVPITGTTTVQGIVTAGWIAGSRVRLELASGILITHNSGAPGGGAVAIQLNAAANLTTTRVTILPLTYNGTFWYQEG